MLGALPSPPMYNGAGQAGGRESYRPGLSPAPLLSNAARVPPAQPAHSTFMIPFQLSPVETWKSVRKAMPKFSKVACRLMPSHGLSSLQTERKGGQLARCGARPASSQNSHYNPRRCVRTVPCPQMERLRLREVAHRLGLRLR